jgi:hypothetical protein
MHCVDGGSAGPVWYCFLDSGEKGMQAEDGAQHGITGPLLCPHVHLVTIFLVDESDGHIDGNGDFTILWNDALPVIAEKDVGNIKGLGSTGGSDGRVFTRLHGKKECHDGKVGSGGLGRLIGVREAGATGFVHCAEELGSDRLLLLLWQVDIVEGL